MQCLIILNEKQKSTVDSGKYFGTFLTDLSKVFDCPAKEQLLGNFNEHGFSLSALKLVCIYQFNGQQKTKINISCNSFEDFLFGAPQGSILRPLRFKNFLCDLFTTLEKNDFASCPDGNTLNLKLRLKTK